MGRQIRSPEEDHGELLPSASTGLLQSREFLEDRRVVVRSPALMPGVLKQPHRHKQALDLPAVVRVAKANLIPTRQVVAVSYRHEHHVWFVAKGDSLVEEPLLPGTVPAHRAVDDLRTPIPRLCGRIQRPFK